MGAASGARAAELAVWFSEVAQRTYPGASIIDVRSLRQNFRGGAYRAVLVTELGRHEIVVRTAIRSRRSLIESEIQILQALEDAPRVRAPKFVFAGRLEHANANMVLATEFVDGDAPQRDFFRELSPQAIEDYTRALARSLPGLQQSWLPGFDELASQARTRGHPIGKSLFRSTRRADDPRGLSASCARALERSIPEPIGMGLVHGEFRIGNAIFAHDAVAAIIDWETWSFGDPRIDLGFLLASTESEPRLSQVGPGGTVNWVVDEYLAAGGVAVPDLEWFVAAGHLLKARNTSARLRKTDIAEADVTGGAARFGQELQKLASRDPQRFEMLLDEHRARQSTHWTVTTHLERAHELLATNEA